MAPDKNIKSAEETYDGFTSWLKIGSIITAVVVIFVIILIS